MKEDTKNVIFFLERKECEIAFFNIFIFHDIKFVTVIYIKYYNTKKKRSSNSNALL